MKKEIFRFLKDYGQEPFSIDQLIVSAFIDINKISVKKNIFLKKYIITGGKERDNLNKFVELFRKEVVDHLHFENLIELFEFVISPADKEVNGAVYTPEYIREFILKEVFAGLEKNNIIKQVPLIADIACGCGGFLFDIANSIHNKTKVSFEKIFREGLFGIDIQEYSITRTKLVLTLLALSKGEDREVFDFNLFIGNSLNFDWKEADMKVKKNGGFDAIVGNPPYVGSSKIDEASKKMLSAWKVTKSGKADLYIPFFEIGMENITNNGILGYITVNTFYKSVNGRALRDYFSENGFEFRMVDFAGEQLFKERSTYTCICIIEKRNTNNLNYIECKSTDIKKLKHNVFLSFSYKDLDNHEGWILKPGNIVKILKKIESTGVALGKLTEIRNGFATLRNDIYVFKPVKKNEKLYLLKTSDNKEYWIEREICVEAIKPNILKSETDINSNKEQLIFPYYIKDSKNRSGNMVPTSVIIPKKIFQKRYPLAFKYLSDHKEILLERDKGKRDYEEWYAFGRNQALTIKGYKLLFPYIADNPYFVLTRNKDLLFYNGYAIVSDNLQKLKIYQKILTSSVFWYYIQNYSKPYNNGYYALAKNYVKEFGICHLTKAEEKWIVNCNKSDEINRFLQEKYDIVV